jgi:hypothetical protein
MKVAYIWITNDERLIGIVIKDWSYDLNPTCENEYPKMEVFK